MTAQLFHQPFVTGEPFSHAAADRAAFIAAAAARDGALGAAQCGTARDRSPAGVLEQYQAAAKGR